MEGARRQRPAFQLVCFSACARSQAPLPVPTHPLQLRGQPANCAYISASCTRAAARQLTTAAHAQPADSPSAATDAIPCRSTGRRGRRCCCQHGRRCRSDWYGGGSGQQFQQQPADCRNCRRPGGPAGASTLRQPLAGTAAAAAANGSSQAGEAACPPPQRCPARWAGRNRPCHCPTTSASSFG